MTKMDTLPPTSVARTGSSPATKLPDRRMHAGDHFPDRRLHSVWDRAVTIPDPALLVHLQFRRYAGCPVCSLHLREFTRRRGELAAVGVKEVIVFHATPETLRAHHADLPFDLVADPERQLYREFGLEPSWLSVLHPAAWWPAIRGTFARGVTLPDSRAGALGLPGDLLIAPDGRVAASHYGQHADNQWSFDEVLALAARHR